ncbi:MAG: electron transfer flavoprotein subunit beta/FixA family protein [Magnetococcales bacterium]|nr:electron transfer flavoprotein subunit beta/FixA family protein [Magnetococcales bacterium]
MIVLVAVKQVPDPNALVRVAPDGCGVESQGARPVLNPFDEIALEAALRLRETGVAREVVVVGIGPESWEGSLRTALAMGADRALLVVAPDFVAPLSVARLLAALIRREGARLLLAGRQAVDLDHGQTGPLTAGILGWGQAVRVVEWRLEEDLLHARRVVDGGHEWIVLPLPVVVTVDLGLNTPRYASLPNIMRARHKPVERILPATLGISIEGSPLETLAVLPPPLRPPGVRVGSVAELAEQLLTWGI